MTAEDIKTACHCDHNYLWTCRHKDQYGKECTGPCPLMEINGQKIICPLCHNPYELGYCVNLKCANHG